MLFSNHIDKRCCLFYFNSDAEEESSVLWIYKLSYMWYSLFGAAIALIVGMIVSLITSESIRYICH